MRVFSRNNLRREQLQDFFGVTTNGDSPTRWYVSAVYTRQTDSAWFFYTGQCAVATDGLVDCVEIYSNFAFVRKIISEATGLHIVERLLADGVSIHPELPPIKLSPANANFSEVVVPSHLIPSALPLRYFSARAEPNAFFNEEVLVDYVLPFQMSSSAYLKTFMGLDFFRGAGDGGKGEVAILVTETRGAIRLESDRVSIVNHNSDVRLVGHINGGIVDIRNGGSAAIDGKIIRDIELFLITKSGELIDYVSSTAWPYMFKPTIQEIIKSEKFFELISLGESEICEFKPYIDLGHEKAIELAKTVCAFSNHKGGTLFVGVNKEGDVIGLAKHLIKGGGNIEQNCIAYEKKLCAHLREMLADTQCFSSQVSTVAGMLLVVVEVVPSEKVNYLIRDEQAQIAYVRHGATSTKMSPQEIIAKNDSARRPLFIA